MCMLASKSQLFPQLCTVLLHGFQSGILGRCSSLQTDVYASFDEKSYKDEATNGTADLACLSTPLLEQALVL